jgi:DNA-binding CsgD family transcriptional regulator
MSQLPALTPREMDVLKLLCIGVISSHDIAEQLVVSENTVRSHIATLMDKLDATSRAELVVRAYSSGMFDAA